MQMQKQKQIQQVRAGKQFLICSLICVGEVTASPGLSILSNTEDAVQQLQPTSWGS